MMSSLPILGAPKYGGLFRGRGPLTSFPPWKCPSILMKQYHTKPLAYCTSYSCMLQDQVSQQQCCLHCMLCICTRPKVTTKCINADCTQLCNIQQYHVYARSTDLVLTKIVQGEKRSWQFTMTSEESVELQLLLDLYTSFLEKKSSLSLLLIENSSRSEEGRDSQQMSPELWMKHFQQNSHNAYLEKSNGTLFSLYKRGMWHTHTHTHTKRLP